MDKIKKIEAPAKRLEDAKNAAEDMSKDEQSQDVTIDRVQQKNGKDWKNEKSEHTFINTTTTLALTSRNLHVEEEPALDKQSHKTDREHAHVCRQLSAQKPVHCRSRHDLQLFSLAFPLKQK